MLTGAYQLTPLKGACLSHCRSPAGFLLTNWRDGVVGRIRMGLEHGLHCVGCCWALMALALVVGMGSLAWMAVLMAVMVAETALPFGARLGASGGSRADRRGRGRGGDGRIGVTSLVGRSSRRRAATLSGQAGAANFPG